MIHRFLSAALSPNCSCSFISFAGPVVAVISQVGQAPVTRIINIRLEISAGFGCFGPLEGKWDRRILSMTLGVGLVCSHFLLWEMLDKVVSFPK